MKILSNKSSVSINKRGIGTYARNLVKNIMHINDDVQYVFLPENFPKVKSIRLIKRAAWNQILLPLHLNQRDHDLFHSMGKGPLIKGNGPLVVTIHDLSPFLFPEYMSFFGKYYFQLFMERQITLADQIIVPSENTKEDLSSLFGVTKKKITVTPLGIDQELFNPNKDSKTNKPKIPKRKEYMLYLGVLKPRKNIPNILKAYSLLKNPEEHLVIGGIGPELNHLKKLAEKLGISKKTIFLGRIPDKALPPLYRNSRLFVFPSFNEGFGLPPLEAMACGTPVITSNTSSLPEVVGDAGIMVDPRDVEGLAEEMRRVLESDTLQKKMKKKSLKRAEKFSWKKTARKTIEVYRKILDN